MNFTEDKISNDPEAIAKNGFERNLAFIIGINNYSNGISPLKTAVNDAKKLVEILRSKHGYKVWVCLDQVATLTNLNQLLEKTLPEQVSENDRLLFYFAGHGVALNGDDGPAGYLIPQDAKGGDTNSYLPMTKLHDAISKLPCRHFLGILDCCFAGAFRWSSTRDLLTAPEVIHKERYDRFITDAAWQIITSSASDQKALDNFNLDSDRGQVGNHSPFAAALLEALEGAADAYPPAKNGKPAGDGVITATELYLHLRDRVEIPTEKYRLRQTPGIWCLNKHDKGEYIFLSPGHELNLPPAPPLDESQNPYRGLKSFDEEHSELFFGRTELVEKLQAFVKTHPLTVVLGASGSGKSSVVKAGLIPILKKETKETSNKWCILSPIRPGETPFRALNNALVNAQLPKVELQNQQKTLTQSIAVWAKNNPNSKLLIFIDQSEEIITLCHSENERQEFFQQILTAINTHRDKLRVVLSLRSDFEPQLRDAGLKFVPTVLQLENTALKNRWQSGRFIVPAMTRGELRQAIEKPAEARVMYFQPHELVEQLIDEVDNMPGALPLLSFALSELYLKYLKRQREAEIIGITIDRALTQEDYQDLGGVIQSLTQKADEEYETLVKKDPAYAQIIRHVMLRMVALGGGEVARRRVPLSELEYPPPKNGLVKEVIESFTNARLLVKGEDTEGNPYVEPAHDALVRGWQKLLEWKQKEEESLLLQRRLTPAAQEWESVKSKQQLSGFQAKAEHIIDWLDRRLLTVENLVNKIPAQLVRLLRPKQNQQEHSRNKPVEFLWDANPYLNVLDKEFNSNDNWLNQVEAKFVQQSVLQKRRNTSWQWRIAITVMVGLFGLTSLALIRQRQALIEQMTADSNSAQTLLRINQPIIDALISSLQAGKSLNNWLFWGPLQPNKQLQSQVIDTLRTAVYQVKERNHWELPPSPESLFALNVRQDMVFTQDDKLLLAISTPDGRNVCVWNSESKQCDNLPESRNHGKVVRVKFSLDGKQLAVKWEDKSVSLWNLDSKQLDDALVDLPGKVIGAVSDISFSPDGSRLAVITNYNDERNIAFLWDWKNKKSYPLPANTENVVGISFKPNGNLVTATIKDDGSIQLRDWQSGQVSQISQFVQNTVYLLGIEFSLEHKQVAIFYGNDSHVGSNLFNWENNKLEELKLGDYQPYYNPSTLSFSSNGELLATTEDNTVHLWRLSSSEKTFSKVSEFKLPQGRVSSMLLSRDGKQLATQGDDGILRLWDVEEPQPPEADFPQAGVESISFSPDHQTIATTDAQGTVRLWNSAGNKLQEFPIPPSKVTSLSFSPDGRQLATGGADGFVRLWDLKGNQLKQFEVLLHQGNEVKEVKSVSWSRDGRRIATVNTENPSVVSLWDVNGNQLESKDYPGRVQSVSFQPNGGLRVVTIGHREDPFNGGKVFLSNISGKSTVLIPTTLAVVSDDSTYFNADGSLIATELSTNIVLWDLQGRQLIKFKAYEDGIKSMSFSADGTKLAVIGGDGKVKLWQLGGLDELLERGCEQVRGYLATLNKNNSDRHLCDDVSK